MGGGLQAGDGRELSFRARLLLAAVAIVAVSLTLSGVVTWFLAQRLAVTQAQEQLNKSVLLLRPRLMSPLLLCPARTQPPANKCIVPTELELIATIDSGKRDYLSAGDRLILLDKPSRILSAASTRTPRVLYDSENVLAPGTPISLGKETQVAGQAVRQGQGPLGGRDYLISAASLPATTPYISWIVVARARDDVTAEAGRQLVRPLLLSAGAGLLLAVLVTMVLGRMFSKPLRELRDAAEDIAGGNYSRRVKATGRDEVGVVGQAFNRMADAVERARVQQRGFLANVSHELKTPLTSLIGFSEALRDGSLQSDEEKARAATILHEEARRVLRMSQELLDLARVESGQLALDLHPVDLGVQLQQEIEIMRPRAESRALVLELALPTTLPPVHADPDRLHQILENLIDNAIKYAPEGTTVWITAEARSGGRVTTSVTNQVGARPPDPERIFDRFYRADPSRSSAGGVGLGLAISRELALAQQGRLTAELGNDGSLCLKLDLPAAARPPAQPEIQSRLPVRLSPRPEPR